MDTVKCDCGFNLVIQDGPETRCRKVYKKSKKVIETCADCGKDYETIESPFGDIFKFTPRCHECELKRDLEAERAYGLKANFEPGTTVVNVITGKKTVVPH